jgi:hypothetical protein
VWGSITLTFTDGIAVSFLRSGRKQAHVRVGAFGKPFGKPSRNRVRSSYRPSCSRVCVPSERAARRLGLPSGLLVGRSPTDGVISNIEERSKVNTGRSTRCRGSRDRAGRSRSRGCRSTATRRLAGRHGRGRAAPVFHRSRHVRTLCLPGNSHRRGRPRIRLRGLRRRGHCRALLPRRAKPHRFPARSRGRRRGASLITNHPDVVKCRTRDVVKRQT